jgi:hypothetical protein
MKFLDQILGRKGIDKVSMDELENEKIRLGVEEKRVVSKIENLENDKAKLFREGTTEPSKRRKTILARKIKEKDEEVKDQDREHRKISKKLRAVERFVRVKKKEKKLKEKGLWQVIADMSPDELEDFLVGEETKSMKEEGRLNEVLGILEEEAGTYEVLDEEEDIKDIVSKMEEAAESKDIDEKYEEMERDVLKNEE